MDNAFTLNVADVPVVKLAEALARGGFMIKTDEHGQMHVLEHVPTLRAPLTARDPLPGVMSGVACATNRACKQCDAVMLPVMCPPLFIDEHTDLVKLEQKFKCLSCGYVEGRPLQLARVKDTGEADVAATAMALQA